MGNIHILLFSLPNYSREEPTATSPPLLPTLEGKIQPPVQWVVMLLCSSNKGTEHLVTSGSGVSELSWSLKITSVIASKSRVGTDPYCKSFTRNLTQLEKSASETILWLVPQASPTAELWAVRVRARASESAPGESRYRPAYPWPGRCWLKKVWFIRCQRKRSLLAFQK